MAGFRPDGGPKYKYGLLESPKTSFFSSCSVNELSTTASLEESRNETLGTSRDFFNVFPDAPRRICGEHAFTGVRPGAGVADLSGISSIIGEQRGKSTEKTFGSDTLQTSVDAETADLNKSRAPARSPGAVISSGCSSPVFQFPTGRAPRKTPKFTAGRTSSHATPGGLDSTLSGRSRSNTPATSCPSKKTPRSVRSDAADTSGTVLSSNIVAIVEGRGLARGEIGMASIDLRHPVLQLSQFSDSQTYVKTITRLQILSPVEIVFPSTMCDAGNMVKIFRVVTDNFQNSNITTVQRHYFNDTRGLDYIKQLCVKERSSVEMDVHGKYYCLAATAALVKYVEFIQNTLFANYSLCIVFKGSEQTTLIDANTAAALELVLNAKDPKSSDTLFGVLNQTRTPGGARLLRSNLLQPPNDLATIISRQECVQELTTEKELFFGLKSCLERFDVDLDSLLTSLIQIPKHETEKTAENKIATCIMLKHILHLIPALEETLSGGKSDLLQACFVTVKDIRFGAILDKIFTVIRDGAQYQKGHQNMRTQKCYAVKSGINGLLDAARRTFSELIEDTNDLITQLASMHSLPIKCAYNASRGFFIQMSLSDKDRRPEMPPVFLKVSRNKSNLSCTTDDLICMNEKINHAVKSIYSMTNNIVSDLLSEIRDSVGCLYNLSETISMLDMLISFAKAATATECVRPEFTDTLALKQGRHPVLEKILRRTKAIPNDICIADDVNFYIITGPNMSGKSTFLKQVALLQVMAQIGSNVPAEYASFRLADQIFSRVGSDDDIETNCSTFMLEMKEINYIIQNVTDNSLVIIDELGRGTSSEEGVGMCWAIAEFILSQKAFTLFATHFLELCQLESLYPNVGNLHFKIDRVTAIEGSLHKIIYTYILANGRTHEKHYGLQLAEHFNFPSFVMKGAWEMAKTLQKNDDEADLKVAKRHRKEKAIHGLASKLHQVSRSSVLEGEALKQYLKSLKTNYLAEIAEIETEKEDALVLEANTIIPGSPMAASGQSRILVDAMVHRETPKSV